MAATDGFRVVFVGNVQKDGHTEYKIQVTDPSESCWCIHKRYREVRELHDQMKLRYPEHLTWFPARRFFGNSETKFIDERQRELQRYMQRLMLLEPLCSSRIIRHFLEVPFQPTEYMPQQVPVVEPSTERSIAFVKKHLLDLSQPCEQFLDPLELEERQRIYANMLKGRQQLPKSTQQQQTTGLRNSGGASAGGGWSDTRRSSTKGVRGGRSRCSSDAITTSSGERSVTTTGTNKCVGGLMSIPISDRLKRKITAGTKSPEWFDFSGPDNAKLWAAVTLAPSVAGPDMANMYRRLFQLSAVNDPGRPIHGIGSLRAQFPSCRGEAAEGETEGRRVGVAMADGGGVGGNSSVIAAVAGGHALTTEQQ
eukprot:GHVS01078998.1.p1 GENE.GHVS01078998.1~~GHVS01078998.1.p1  ORF type:complete len:366 (-),score=68.23 GHVS01078998.1:30-1127(-)